VCQKIYKTIVNQENKNIKTVREMYRYYEFRLYTSKNINKDNKLEIQINHGNSD